MIQVSNLTNISQSRQLIKTFVRSDIRPILEDSFYKITFFTQDRICVRRILPQDLNRTFDLIILISDYHHICSKIG